MSMSGDEIKLRLRIDTDAVADDLQTIDREVQRIQGRMVSAFNRSSLVRRGRVARAASIEDVGEQRGAWTPELRALDRQLGARLQAIERAARTGATRPPLTSQQAAQQAARSRLQQVERQMRPVEITAKSEFFDKFTQALRRGSMNAAALAGAQTGIPGAAGLSRSLMGLIADNPMLSGILGLGAGTAGLGLAIGAQQAAFQRTQASLASALVGGPAFGSARTLQGLAVIGAGQGLDAWSTDAQAAALSLASAGVSRGNLLGNLSNALMVSQPAGLKPGDVTPLVGAMATAGGMNANDINRVLQDTVSVSKDAGVSLQELLQGMTALSKGAISASRDVLSLAAIQRIVGPSSGIQAGALMQGVMSATGSQAFQAAGMLGMTPAQFLSAQLSQGGMATVWDKISAFTKRMPGGAAGFEATTQLLSQSGLLNMQDLSVKRQFDLYNTLRTQGAGAAEKLAAQYTADTGPGGKFAAVSFAQSMKNAAASTDNLTSAQQRLWMMISNIWTGVVNAPGKPLPIGGGPGPGIGTGPMGASSYKFNQNVLGGYLSGGMYVSDTRGQKPYADPSIVNQAWIAAKGNPAVFSMMMATMARESDFTAAAVGKGPHPGYGIAQFTDTLGAANLRKYLGPGDWRKNALDQTKAIAGLGALDADLLARAGGNPQLAASMYNGQPLGPGQITGYGTAVGGVTQTIEGNLQITVVVQDQNGHRLAHTVDHKRVTVGATHHGHPPPTHPHHRR